MISLCSQKNKYSGKSSMGTSLPNFYWKFASKVPFLLMLPKQRPQRKSERTTTAWSLVARPLKTLMRELRSLIAITSSHYCQSNANTLPCRIKGNSRVTYLAPVQLQARSVLTNNSLENMDTYSTKARLRFLRRFLNTLPIRPAWFRDLLDLERLTPSEVLSRWFTKIPRKFWSALHPTKQSTKFSQESLLKDSWERRLKTLLE